MIVLLIGILFALTGCISTPSSYQFGGRMVRTVSVMKAGCKEPFQLDQDCSGMSGGTRLIDYKGTHLRIAGSSDGTIVFFMAESKWKTGTLQLKITLENLERDLSDRGITVLDTVAVAGNGQLAGVYMVFSAPIYEELKALTIEG